MILNGEDSRVSGYHKKRAHNKNNPPISDQIVDEAMLIAKGTQKPKQTKEQTKLIAQGIQKGIAEYKKQQKVKIRQQNKEKKKSLKKQNMHPHLDSELNKNKPCKTQWFAWVLLFISWLGMAFFIIQNNP